MPCNWSWAAILVGYIQLARSLAQASTSACPPRPAAWENPEGSQPGYHKELGQQMQGQVPLNTGKAKTDSVDHRARGNVAVSTRKRTSLICSSTCKHLLCRENFAQVSNYYFDYPFPLKIVVNETFKDSHTSCVHNYKLCPGPLRTLFGNSEKLSLSPLRDCQV
ncbi:hypothetical protein MC885_020222 [Smutsia gigantea]|nr:hypothetical protein MC885_020222 [Smutsia gigantea]